MNTKLWAVAALLAVAAAGTYLFVGSTPRASAEPALQGHTVTVYKTSTCGCCSVYVNYLKNNHVDVVVKDVDDLSAIKAQYGIPAAFGSCHTSIVDGYVVEGHMPLEIIEQLLAERPAVAGIALPGMPSGSPGMPGPKMDAWTIHSFMEGKAAGIFTTY